MDKKTKGKVISTLRKLTFTHKARSNVKNRYKVAPATFVCSQCGKPVYEGKSEDKFNLLQEEFPNIEMGKIHMDHIDPVIPIEGFYEKEWDWDIYINRLLCDESGWQTLCAECHDIKTQDENEQRKTYRSNKKKVDK